MAVPSSSNGSSSDANAVTTAPHQITPPTYPVLTPDIISRILSSPVPQGKGHCSTTTSSPLNQEDEALRRIVDSLSPSELEEAARTSSYAYHIASANSDASIRSLATSDARRTMAMRTARRHLNESRWKGDADSALTALRANLRWRRQNHVNDLRFCFRRPRVDMGTTEEGTEEQEGGGSGDTKGATQRTLPPHPCASLTIRCDEIPPKSVLSRYESMISDDQSAQPLVVNGRDLSNRALVVKFPRTSSRCDEESYVWSHVYVAERASATTEYLTRGSEEKVSAAVNFIGYGESCRPPFKCMRALASTLQEHYPERLEAFVLVQPPLWMRAAFAMLGPFLDADTKKKVMMVHGGEVRRDEILSALVTKEFAMPFLRPGGKLDDSVDVKKYLREVPFFAPYDSLAGQ